MTQRANQIANLEAFLQGHPTIKYISPSSENYANAYKGWNGSRRDIPLSIVQPQSHTDVCTLIKYLKSNSLPFTLRAGGHNLEGRAVVDGALLIDLRLLTGVTIAPDRKSAVIQGGTLQDEVGNTLWKDGLGTATGSIPSVGYVGWATYGGYGPFSSHWGLGADQIISATVVNPDGDIYIADRDLLQGVRGAGGLFGVILEVTVKVYPLSTLLAGPIVFDSTDIKKTFIDFNAAYQQLETEGIPTELTVQQTIFNGPHGAAFAIQFVWSGENLEDGQNWSEKIAALGPVSMNGVIPTNLPDWFAGIGAHIPRTAYGSPYSHNVSSLSPTVAEIIGNGIAEMPNNPGTMMSIHQLRGKALQCELPSVFEAREPHFMLEIIGFSTDSALLSEAEKWAAGIADNLIKVALNAVLPTHYISVFNSVAQASSPAEWVEKTYGTKVDTLKRLKTKFDPENLFALTVPTLR